MLAREHRLTSSADFLLATRQGRRAGSGTLVVHLRVAQETEAGPGPARVGFVVSKAVGNAVHRNRVKRRLKHLAREHVSSLPGSAVLVIRALPPAAAASYGDLGRDLARCLERVSGA